MLSYKQLFRVGYQHRQLLVLTCVLTILAAVLSYYKNTETLDWLLYDSVQQFSYLPPANDLVVINIDERSINALGRWPWSRDVHAKLLARLTEAGTAAVVMDIIFSDRDPSNVEADKQFAKAIEAHGRVVFPLFIKQTGLQGQVLEVPPAKLFYQSEQSIGHVHVSHDRDGVVRSVFLKEGVGLSYWPHLSLALWRLLGEDGPLPGTQSTMGNLVDNPNIIARNYLNYLPMPGSQQGLLHLSYIDVLNGDVDFRSLHNKIVFVGATAAGLGDTLTTSVGSMAGVELNAWIFHALLNHAFIQEISGLVAVVINSLITLILLLGLGRLSPNAFFTASLCSIIGWLAISATLQLVFHQWLSIMPAIIAVVAFYPLWSWWRLNVALDFLRQELDDLSDLANQGQQQVNRTGSNEKEIEYRVREPRGTELITRTIDQLVEIKHRADANKRLIQQSLAQLQDAVVISDLSNRIMFTNTAFDILTMQSINNPVGLLDALAPIEPNNNNCWVKILHQMCQTKKSFTIQCVHTNLDKDMFCQGRLANIGGQVEDTVIIVVTDISQLKAAEKARLEALNFLSHDLRSPMLSVLAIIERQRLSPTIDQAILHPIEVLVRKNLDYADSFLHLSRAESLQTSQLCLCDLHSVLDSAQMHALALTESKKIKLITERVEHDAWVMGDHDLLERAVINLLSNAVKYSPTGSIITLSLAYENEQYQLRVSDQGCGIAQKDLPTLFERYTRSNQHYGVMGAGLGLYFVATVAKRHHGTINVDTSQGQGSTFTLSLNSSTE